MENIRTSQATGSISRVDSPDNSHNNIGICFDLAILFLRMPHKDIPVCISGINAHTGPCRNTNIHINWCSEQWLRTESNVLCPATGE